MIQIEEIPVENINEFWNIHMQYLTDDILVDDEDKCFILDYWVFPAYRGNGTGHRCFEALRKYTMKDGASYYELNAAGNDSRRIRFWESLGFVENGVDEYGVGLFIL